MTKKIIPNQKHIIPEIIKRLSDGSVVGASFTDYLCITQSDNTLDPAFSKASSYSTHRALLRLIGNGEVEQYYETPDGQDISLIPYNEREQYIRYRLNPRHPSFKGEKSLTRPANSASADVYHVPVTEIPGTHVVLIGEGLGIGSNGVHHVL